MALLSRKGTHEISLKVTVSRVDPKIMAGTFLQVLEWRSPNQLSIKASKHRIGRYPVAVYSMLHLIFI